MNTFDELFDLVNANADQLVPEGSESAFLFLSADKDDINASFAGKKRNLVAMVVAHMAASDNIREILSEAVCFYAMHHKELENLE